MAYAEWKKMHKPDSERSSWRSSWRSSRRPSCDNDITLDVGDERRAKYAGYPPHPQAGGAQMMGQPMAPQPVAQSVAGYPQAGYQQMAQPVVQVQGYPQAQSDSNAKVRATDATVQPLFAYLHAACSHAPRRPPPHTSPESK